MVAVLLSHTTFGSDPIGSGEHVMDRACMGRCPGALIGQRIVRAAVLGNRIGMARLMV